MAIRKLSKAFIRLKQTRAKLAQKHSFDLLNQWERNADRMDITSSDKRRRYLEACARYQAKIAPHETVEAYCRAEFGDDETDRWLASLIRKHGDTIEPEAWLMACSRPLREQKERAERIKRMRERNGEWWKGDDSTTS